MGNTRKASTLSKFHDSQKFIFLIKNKHTAHQVHITSKKKPYFSKVSIWMRTNVTPTLKADSQEKVENYRPISLLSIFAKSQERIVRNAIYSFKNKWHCVQFFLGKPLKSGSLPDRLTAWPFEEPIAHA